MRTAEQMFQYCKNNKFGDCYSSKDFEYFEKNLQPDEDVLLTLVGCHNFSGYLNAIINIFDVTSKEIENYIYVITNKRLMFHEKGTSGRNFTMIPIENIIDITCEHAGLLTGDKVIFHIKDQKISVSDNVNFAGENFAKKAKEILIAYKSNNQNQQSGADEILKYKSLLDHGIITQEEFELKKKQLLNL